MELNRMGSWETTAPDLKIEKKSDIPNLSTLPHQRPDNDTATKPLSEKDRLKDFLANSYATRSTDDTLVPKRKPRNAPSISSLLEENHHHSENHTEFNTDTPLVNTEVFGRAKEYRTWIANSSDGSLDSLAVHTGTSRREMERQQALDVDSSVLSSDDDSFIFDAGVYRHGKAHQRAHGADKSPDHPLRGHSAFRRQSPSNVYAAELNGRHDENAPARHMPPWSFPDTHVSRVDYEMELSDAYDGPGFGEDDYPSQPTGQTVSRNAVDSKFDQKAGESPRKLRTSKWQKFKDVFRHGKGNSHNLFSKASTRTARFENEREDIVTTPHWRHFIQDLPQYHSPNYAYDWSRMFPTTPFPTTPGVRELGNSGAPVQGARDEESLLSKHQPPNAFTINGNHAIINMKGNQPIPGADSADTATQTQALVASVTTLLETAVGQIVTRLADLAPPSDSPTTHTTPSQQSKTTSAASKSASSSARTPGRTSKFKRTRYDYQDGRHIDEESHGSEESDIPQRIGGRKKGPASPPRRPRCPFYLRDPHRYEHIQACSSGKGFKDMAALHQHLKRVHLQPRRCYRCQEEMDSEASLAEHMRQSKGCDMQPPVSDTRISREIWANLDALKSGGRRLRVEQKWKLLYEAIFPDDETIPSPYGPPLIGKDMAQLLFDEIGRALMSEFGPTLEPVLLRAKDRLPSMVEACTARLNAPIDWRSADDMIPGPGIPNPSPSSTGLLPQVTAISNSSTSLQASSVVSTSNQPSIFETHTDVSSNDSSIDRLDSTEMCPRNAGPVTLALRSEEMMTLDDIVQLLNSECGPSRTKTSHSHVTSGPAAHCANSIAGYGGGIDEFTSCGFLDTKQEIPSSLTDEAFDYTQWLEEEELD